MDDKRPLPSLSLRRAALSLSLGGILGKASGIARELYLAAAFGTSPIVAAFRVAQSATLIPMNLVASDSLNSAFLPLHGRLRPRSPAQAEDFYRTVQRALLITSTAVAAIVFVAAPVAAHTLGPGLSRGVQRTVTDMVRVMALGIPLFVAGALNSYLALSLGRYRLVSLRSTIQNVGLLSGVAAAATTGNWIFLAWGFTAGCAAYSLCGAGYVWKQNLLESKSAWLGWYASAQIIKPFAVLMRGLLIVPLIIQTNEALERIVASFLGTRTVAATEFANFVADTCVTVIAVPLALAGISAVDYTGDVMKSVRRRASALTPPLLLIGMPVSLVLSLRAGDATTLLYARGHFDAASAAATATVLTGFAIGLWAQLLAYVYTKLYSATMQLRRLLRVIGIGCLASIGTMAVAVPTKDALFIGLGGTAFGVVVTLMAATEMHLTAELTRWIVQIAPGAGLIAVLSWAMPLGSAGAFVAFGFAAAGVWAAYCGLVPPLRRQVRQLLRGRGQTIPRGATQLTPRPATD